MYSFDVFDTMITRKTAVPQGIFTIMGYVINTAPDYQHISKHIKNNFYELRVNAEQLARLNNEAKQIEEVNLEDIYTAMSMTGCITREDLMLLCELERRTEIEYVVGIDENISKVKQLLSQGEEVILISDMYLDGSTIRSMLIKTDEVFTDIPLFVSSEYRKRKHTSSLYRFIHDIMNVEYSEWIHCGDNMLQDIQVPKTLGIKTEYYQPEKLTAFEEELIMNHSNSEKLQLIIGSARNARRSFRLQTIAEKIGCTYSGPILCGYTEWVLEEACSKGIKRLYFIARDGYLLKQIADILIQKRKLNINTYYIYGSRKAWRIPSLTKDRFDLYRIIQWSYSKKIKTVKDLADVLMLDVSDLLPFLPIGCQNANTSVTNQNLNYLAKRLERDVAFIELMINSHKEIRSLAIDYLKQEIDMSDDLFAFVDLSGGGLTQGCLSNLLKGTYNKPIHTFFLKIDRVNLVDHCVNFAYIPSFLKNHLVIEMICRAPHGQTAGYEVRNGKIVPILEDAEGKAFVEKGYLEYQKGIEGFTKQMSDLYQTEGSSIFTIDAVLKYFNFIAKRPDMETLEFFASMPNSDTGRDKKLLEYAPKLSKEDIESLYLIRTYEPIEDYYKGTNLEYSLLRCSPDELEYIEKCKLNHKSELGLLARKETIDKEAGLTAKYGPAARFPCEILDEKIIIYGAGKFGQGLYKKVTDLGIHHIILWVDKDSKSYNKQGLHLIEKPEQVNNYDYDQIVIAVKYQGLAEEIRKELIALQVPEDKIIWMSTDPYRQNYVLW